MKLLEILSALHRSAECEFEINLLPVYLRAIVGYFISGKSEYT